MTWIHHGTHQTTAQLAPSPEQGIQVFLAWQGRIYIWYGLVDKLLGTQVVLEIEEHQLHHLQHLRLGDTFANHQSAVGEALVGIHTPLLFMPVGRKECLHIAHLKLGLARFVREIGVVHNQHATVSKARGMIIHKSTFKEERTVLGRAYKLIPYVPIINRIR